MKKRERLRIINAKLVLEEGVVQTGELIAEDGIIVFAGNCSGLGQLTGMETIDAGGGWLLPGFIDLHVHGGFGSDFMDASPEAYRHITQYHAGHGTTGMLATTVTASREAIEQVLAASWEFQRAGMPYARLLGVHLEGPFISPHFPGAQNPDYLIPPRKDWLEDWESRYPGLIRLLTLAPETEGAGELIQWLSLKGIIPACGHTDATYDILEQAAERGLRHAVHVCNAMRGLHHREPGTLGAVLTDNRLFAEVIADGHHVHPAVIRLLTKTKAPDRLMLVTDAMSAAGLGDGSYKLGGLEVRVQGGVARLAEGNNLAGSTLTMDAAFRFMKGNTPLSLPEISRLASGNPARQLGIFDQTGSIAPGKQADLVLLSDDLHTRQVWVGGRTVRMSSQ